MIINFDNYRKTPVVYADELDGFNVARLHNTDHYAINTYIPPSSEEFNASALSDTTIIRNGLEDYFKNLYNEQRRIEMSDDYERY